MLSISVKNIDAQNWVEELKTGWIVIVCTDKQKLKIVYGLVLIKNLSCLHNLPNQKGEHMSTIGARICEFEQKLGYFLNELVLCVAMVSYYCKQISIKLMQGN